MTKKMNWHETRMVLLPRQTQQCVHFEGVAGHRGTKTLSRASETTKRGPGSRGILPAYSCCSDALVVQLVVPWHVFHLFYE